MAQKLSDFYPNDSNFRVFCRGSDHNRKEFGINEFLHDISVCEVGFVTSFLHKKTLTVVHRVVWQIESEFAKDTRKLVFDFNKLVAGSASNKLFIAPVINRRDQLLRVLREPANFCSGKVYLALVPHPADWPAKNDTIEILRLENGVWVQG